MSERDCTHGLTLEGVVETCAECKAVLSHRPSNEPVMREALERIAAVAGGQRGGVHGYEFTLIHKVATEALASLSPPSTNEEGERE